MNSKNNEMSNTSDDFRSHFDHILKNMKKIRSSKRLEIIELDLETPEDNTSNMSVGNDSHFSIDRNEVLNDDQALTKDFEICNGVKIFGGKGPFVFQFMKIKWDTDIHYLDWNFNDFQNFWIHWWNKMAEKFQLFWKIQMIGHFNREFNAKFEYLVYARIKSIF